MTKFHKPWFTHRNWTANDINKKLFVVQASLDTFVTNQLFDFDKAVLNGMDMQEACYKLFHFLAWFLNQPLCKDNGANVTQNYTMLAEILTDKLKTDYLYDDNTHVFFDGEIGTL